MVVLSTWVAWLRLRKEGGKGLLVRVGYYRGRSLRWWLCCRGLLMMWWWPRKPIKQSNFKVKKTCGEQSQEINPLYQIEIYSSRIPIHSKANTITKLSYEPLKLLWCELAPTWILVHVLIFSMLDSWNLTTIVLH